MASTATMHKANGYSFVSCNKQRFFRNNNKNSIIRLDEIMHERKERTKNNQQLAVRRTVRACPDRISSHGVFCHRHRHLTVSTVSLHVTVKWSLVAGWLLSIHQVPGISLLVSTSTVLVPSVRRVVSYLGLPVRPSPFSLDSEVSPNDRNINTRPNLRPV